MSKYKKGDKFVLEIEEVYAADDSTNASGRPTKLYRMKGFNSLVFDQNGLKNLIRLLPCKKMITEEKAAQFDNGVSFAENVYKKLCDLPQSQLLNLFGYMCVENIIRDISCLKIYNTLSALENKIVVGDVVRINMQGSHRYFLVTSVGGKLCDGLFQDGLAISTRIKNVTKTRFSMKRVDAWLGSQGQEVVEMLVKEESN